MRKCNLARQRSAGFNTNLWPFLRGANNVGERELPPPLLSRNTVPRQR
jgi:hypothetical protein